AVPPVRRGTLRARLARALLARGVRRRGLPALRRRPPRERDVRRRPVPPPPRGGGGPRGGGTPPRPRLPTPPPPLGRLRRLVGLPALASGKSNFRPSPGRGALRFALHTTVGRVPEAPPPCLFAIQARR